MTLQRTVEAVRAVLTDDLRRPPWKGSTCPVAGHCYVASEVVYHLAARDLGYKPATVRHEGVVHWFLIGPDGTIVDPTAEQFVIPVPYALGRGRGFLTREPSARARVVMDRVRTEA